MHPVGDLKTWLAGSWSLERIINDHKHGKVNYMSGIVDFSSQRDGLVYHEQSKFVNGPHDYPTHQSYRYTFPFPHRAEVCFSDGRYFHMLDLSTGSDSCLYKCGSDIYKGKFKVVNAEQLYIEWNILGPKKKMTIQSVLKNCKETANK